MGDLNKGREGGNFFGKKIEKTTDRVVTVFCLLQLKAPTEQGTAQNQLKGKPEGEHLFTASGALRVVSPPGFDF